MIMPAKMFKARWEYGRVWSHNSRPRPSPSPQGAEGPTEFAALYRFNFWKMDFRSIHREGPRRAMPH